MNKTLYLAGPMSGLPEYNFPAFHKAEEEMKHYGFDVLNPARNFGGRTDLPWAVYMTGAIAQVFQATHVLMLNGWEFSAGAKIEQLVATCLGLEIFDEQSQPVPYQPDLWGFDPLERAKSLVYGDRNAAYGPPVKDFHLQAQCLSSLGLRVGDNPVNLLHIPVIMNVVKLCRESNKKREDNIIDLAGYSLCYKWCLNELAKKETNEPQS